MAHARPAGTLPRWPQHPARSAVAVALLFCACSGVGALYAVTAYRLDPAVVPAAAAALIAVGLGLWRLEIGLAIIVVVTPFAENAPISDPNGAKLRIALIAWAALLVATQLAQVALQRERVRVPPMFTASTCFIAAGVLAVPFALDVPSAAAKLLLLSGAVMLAFLVGSFLTEWRQLEVLLGAIVLVGLVISVHAIFQYFVGDVSRVGFVGLGGEVEYRITSTFPHPNGLAGFLALLVPFSVGLVGVFQGRLMRAACVLLAALALVAVVLTYSRGALVGLIALPVILLHKKAAWPLIGAAVAVITVMAPDVWRSRVVDVAQIDGPEIATRLDFWDAALHIFAANPVLGAGLNSFGPAYEAVERPGRTFLGGGFLDAPDTAHNLYLTVLAEQGLVGLAALTLLVVSFIAMSIRLARSPDSRVRAMALGLLGSGVVLLVHNFFDATFSDPKTATLVWIMFGAGAAVTLIDSRQRAAGETPPR